WPARHHRRHGTAVLCRAPAAASAAAGAGARPAGTLAATPALDPRRGRHRLDRRRTGVATATAYRRNLPRTRRAARATGRALPACPLRRLTRRRTGALAAGRTVAEAAAQPTE